MKSLLHFSYYMIRKYFQYRILAHVLSDKELLANLSNFIPCFTPLYHSTLEKTSTTQACTVLALFIFFQM